eukprot:TRINITY_DN9610_c0_g1_i1.p1 TRINITY_DN9610_c0_g1~~TRINITY_DN9610_c0_g1_i1.p1  ORF type:complete len:491 (+),score=156.57 TRINITY_DN9610_c0_g1_i1:35-1507(+)
MMMILTSVTAVVLGIQCTVPDDQKIDCGHVGTNQQQCEAAGCCWQPEGMGSQTPWCFFPEGVDTCTTLIMNATSPGFPSDFISAMQKNFLANLNIQGSGGVVAAPDNNVPGGGSYYYHWMRDAGLSTRAYMSTNDNAYSTVSDVMGAYQKWVAARQVEQDPNGINILTEPKFNLPDGSVFTGGWCRPQTDGPALRANSMTRWANILLSNGKNSEVDAVAQLIETDLAWVVNNWQSNSCDLWEEVQSTDFFWNRMAYVHALTEGAALLVKLGQSSTAATYTSTASTIRATLANHWNGNYYYESTNREVDGSVIHAIVSFGGNDTDLGPLSDKAASTLAHYEQVFCSQYPINNNDTAKGVPGIMIGRYPGDQYGGGNPWQLLTAAVAELYYAVSLGVSTHSAYQAAMTQPFKADDANFKGWRQHLGAKTPSELAASAKSSGDSVMTRLFYHVQGNGVVYEQIDKYNGTQKSAYGLTWSYANILNALHMRSKL